MTGRTHRATQHRSALPGVEAMTLFTDHAFPRHAHDGFGVGVMTTGAQRSWSGIGPVESEAGDVIAVNPGEMHDGAPLGGQARGWRMLYFDPALVAREVAQEGEDRPEIVRPALRDHRRRRSHGVMSPKGDRALSALFARLFARVTATSAAPLAAEEALLCTLVHLLRRHGNGTRRRRDTAPPPAVAAALRRLDAAPERPATLAELAALSGVSRFQLLRGFARAVGTTPHAYLVQRRVRLARRLLAAGHVPAEAALRAGFADQSHLTRAFVRQFGTTPARYRAAVA